MLYTLEMQHTHIEEIRATQNADLQLERIRVVVLVGKALGFMIQEDGALRFQIEYVCRLWRNLRRKSLIRDIIPHTQYSLEEINSIRT